MIPEHLLYQGISTDKVAQLEKWVTKNRTLIGTLPSFQDINSAVSTAVEMAQKDELSLPGVWATPKDMELRYAVVICRHREKAYNAGYTETVTEQQIFDLTNGIQREQAPEDGPCGIDRWTSNGYGLSISGQKVDPVR